MSELGGREGPRWLRAQDGRGPKMAVLMLVKKSIEYIGEELSV